MMVPDHHVEILGLLTARTDRNFGEFDSIYPQAKAQPSYSSWCTHRSPHCSARFRKYGSERGLKDAENPTSGLGSATAHIPARSAEMASHNSLPDTCPALSCRR